jgi:excinuclease ABC subunit C
MNLSSLQKQSNKLPNTPGVYFFCDSKKKILYIGKATSLKDRVKSYFAKDLANTRGPLIVQMIEKAKSISFEKTDSVLEALILEANLIKKHKPYFNTKEKDDKSFNYIVITEEDFPRILLIRGKDLQSQKLEAKSYKLKASFGPFPQGGTLKDALKIIRKIFPYRDKCVPNSGRPCFNAQLGLCPGVCAGIVSQKQYKSNIKNLTNFLEGKKSKVISSFEKEMKSYIKVQNFEKANEIKKRLFALNHIQDIGLIKRKITSGVSDYRLEAYDVAHLSGNQMVGVMTVVENGLPNKNEYRKFKIKTVSGANDPAALKEVLQRRFNHSEWPMSNIIVVDGNETQKKTAENVVLDFKFNIKVVAVVKDERHKARAIIGDENVIKEHRNSILLANSEAHRFAISFHKLLRKKSFLA